MEGETQAETQLFQRFIEPGRLCIIRFGPDYEKLAVVVDIIDQNRILVDGPTTGVKRQSIPLRRLQLTDFVVRNVGRGSRTRTLAKCLEADETVKKFNESSIGKLRAERAFKQNMTDFQRFHLLVAHKRRRALIQKALGKKK